MEEKNKKSFIKMKEIIDDLVANQNNFKNDIETETS